MKIVVDNVKTKPIFLSNKKYYYINTHMCMIIRDFCKDFIPGLYTQACGNHTTFSMCMLFMRCTHNNTHF